MAILSVQGFGLILPNEVRVLLELRKANPNTEKVVKLGMRNIYFAGSQAIFQIAIIARAFRNGLLSCHVMKTLFLKSANSTRAHVQRVLRRRDESCAELAMLWKLAWTNIRRAL